MRGASVIEGVAVRTWDAAVVAVPATLMMSLTEMGTPWRGPRYFPAAISESKKRADSRAELAEIAINAFKESLSVEILVKHCSTTSMTFTDCDFISPEISTMEQLGRGLLITGVWESWFGQLFGVCVDVVVPVSLPQFCCCLNERFNKGVGVVDSVVLDSSFQQLFP